MAHLTCSAEASACPAYWLTTLLSVLLLGSCSTGSSARYRIPPSVSFNKGAGHRDPLVVMVGLHPGEQLPFLLDTGSPVVCFDKTLEPRLGKRLGAVTANNFGVKHEASVFQAPQLFLGRTPLASTGTKVITFDFEQVPPKGPRPYVGILGMAVLRNYCVQLDFSAHRIRFLAAVSQDRARWGTKFSLSDVGDGCVAIDDNLVGTRGSGSLIDTGYSGDGFLTPELFQRWTNHTALRPEGEARAPEALLGGLTYSAITEVNPESLSLGDPPRALSGIGLYFLSRHLVTFDFPDQTLYLKRTSEGPLLDEDTKAALDNVARLLERLKKKGQLPGWSRKDAFANKAETVQLISPTSASFQGIRKQGDPSIYHYEFCRPAINLPWRLHKAWRTDQDGRAIEYPLIERNSPHRRMP